MEVLQTTSFRRNVKKLHANQKKNLDAAIKKIIDAPEIGEAKLGDLAGIRVYKFKMVKQLTLLAYSFEKERIVLTLLAIGSNENFYRDLKRS